MNDRTISPQKKHESWPKLSAEEFKISSHLLHRAVQLVGKLMLYQPFEPHWGNLAMPLTSRGITTGLIPYPGGMFSVDMDFIDHHITLNTTGGQTSKIKLTSISVANLTQQFFKALNDIGVELKINLKPQEVSNPIPFDLDTEIRTYDEIVVNKWWRIMVSTYSVMQQYHAKFYGITPNVGLFWGTLDLRDARYKGSFLSVPKTAGFIARNSMDDEQFEVGWSCSNEKYPYPSFFVYAYPTPNGFQQSNIKPVTAKWVEAINEFILDYADIQQSSDPDQDLLLFFDSCYQAFSELAEWDPKLIVSGKPL